MAGEKLRVRSGNAAGTAIDPSGGFTFGRSQPGQGTLAGDPELSREHARITTAPGGGLTIEDLGSTNGTFVNGQRVTGAQPLRPGDTVKVGQTEMVVEGDDQATALGGAAAGAAGATVIGGDAPTTAAPTPPTPPPGPPTPPPGPPPGAGAGAGRGGGPQRRRRPRRPPRPPRLRLPTPSLPGARGRPPTSRTPSATSRTPTARPTSNRGARCRPPGTSATTAPTQAIARAAGSRRATPAARTSSASTRRSQARRPSPPSCSRTARAAP